MKINVDKKTEEELMEICDKVGLNEKQKRLLSVECDTQSEFERRFAGTIAVVTFYREITRPVENKELQKKVHNEKPVPDSE